VISGATVPESSYRFGEFELDLARFQLRRKGRTLKLQRIPMELLILLAEKDGEVVTRQEIIQRLWGGNIFVDTEHGINTAIRKIRAALHEDAERPQFVQTVTGKGYRFVIETESVRGEDNPRPLSEPAPETKHPEQPPSGSDPASDIPTDLQRLKHDTESTRIAARQESPDKATKHRKLWVAAGCSIAAIGLVAGGGWYLRSGRTTQIDSIAVLPFTNVSRDADVDYLSDGITESLIASLTHVPELKVKSRNSVFRYRGKDVDVQKVGNLLGVSAVVSGRVTSHAENVEVSAELTDIRDNTEIWGQHYSGKGMQIVSLQQQIGGDIAEKLRSKLSGSEKQQVTKQGTHNPKAFEFYLKGRYYQNKETYSDIATAISYLNQAIANDPGYALAYSGLGDAYSDLASYADSASEYYLKSTAAARKALELDATLAEPHAVLASNKMQHDWDFAGGEAEYKKAFELDPNDASTHYHYAFDIGLIGGREEEAFAEINRAHQLDPLSVLISTTVGYLHDLARQYDEAIVVCKQVARENPTFVLVHGCLLDAYRGKRMYPEAIEEWKALGPLAADGNDSEFASAVEQGFHSAGWKGALIRGIETRQAQRKARTRTNPSYAIGIADLYADLGNKDQAFRWLNIAYQERNFELEGLKTDFLLDSLRSDPRFAELVRKVGLPQ
jgi:TolB-like protein/DNA-binding winged helix-turn-helix (wHTH) protein